MVTDIGIVFLKNDYKGSLVGYDTSKTALEIAKKDNNKFSFKYIYSNAYDISSSDNKFDCSFSLQLWQLLDEPEDFLDEIIRITKNNGEIYISTTNFYTNLLFQPTQLFKYLIRKKYPNNHTSYIKKILSKNNLKYKINYLTFRPRQPVLKYIPSALFKFIFNKCRDIENILGRLGLLKLCSITLISINEKHYERKKIQKKLSFYSIISSVIIFLLLIFFHWIIDIALYVKNLINRFFKLLR